MKKIYILLSLFSIFASAQTGTSTEVGVTEGQLAVSLTGGATYTVPIAVPLGINGVVPQLSLTYNSQGGNGLAGYGWNISGISSITRIPSTKFHDNTIDAVDFDSLDRFAFDGQRLVVKSGTTGIYGADGTVYETESFSNVKITSYGVNPNGATYGPAYFLVEYPDGSKAYYGNSIDSLSLTDWAITYWENPQGVRISYAYTLATNSLRIASIKYGTTGATAGINQINFIYKTRQRPEQAYVAGQSVLNSNLLSEINVLGNGVGFRNYVLAHDVTSLGYERLVSITEKSGDGTKSYNPTVFSYGIANEAILYNSITTNLDVSNVSATNSASIPGDFNGDGKMDFLLYPTTGVTAKTKYWLFANLDPNVTTNTNIEHITGSFKDVFASSLLIGNTTTGYKLTPKQGWAVVKNDVTTNTTTFSNYTLEVGVNPITLQYEKSYQFPKFSWVRQTICGNYSSYATDVYDVPKSYVSGDFNGDGLTDEVVIEQELMYTSTCDQIANRPGGIAYFVNLDKRLTSNFVTNAGAIESYSGSRFYVADFDGDGKSDIYVFETGFVKVYAMNELNQFVLLYRNTVSDPNISSYIFYSPILMGDYNGDGKSDFILPTAQGSNSYFKYIATGTSFIKTNEIYSFPSVITGIGCTSSLIQAIPNDINKDGKTDLIFINKQTCPPAGRGGSIRTDTTLFVYKNTGTSFALGTNYQLANTTPIGTSALPIFLNYDKLNNYAEFNFISDNKILNFSYQKDFSKEKLLQTIKTGNGVTETVTYSPIDKDPCSFNCHPVYTDNANTENYPNIDILVAPSFQVVSKLEKQSATVYKKQLFAYAGATSNVEGLGFLGFRATMRTNWIDNNTATPTISSISKSDISLRGANTENYQVLNWASPSSSFAPTTFISKSVLTYQSQLLANKVFKLTNTVAQQFNGLDNTSSQTTTVYDGYNNPTQATTTVSNGTTVEQTSVNNVAYAPPTAAPYVVGRPVSKLQSVTAYSDTTTSEELYTYTNNLLTQVKKRGNDAGVYITEDNVYDTFGNITQKKITAPAIGTTPAPAPRTTNYEYDASGRFLTKSIDIEGLATTFDYNTSNGLLLSETNPYGLTTTYLYDAWFKKIKTTDYLGKSNNYAYTRTGNINTLITTTGDDGSSSSELFDDLGRKTTTSVKDIGGLISNTSYLYDIYDRNIQVSEPYYGTTPTLWNKTVYDDYGRISQSIAATGKTVTMNYSGLTTTINDGTKTKQSSKNALGNVVTMTDTPGGTINYTYYTNGNLKTTNYGGVITTITQDGWGRKTQLVDPSAGPYSYTYNGFGETLTETTPNGTTTYTLNAVGKLTAKTIAGTNTNSSTVYNYDATTKLPTSNTFTNLLEGNSTITNTYGYDTFKRLNSTTEVTPFATFSKALTFDAFGRVNTETSTATVTATGKSSTKTIQNTYQNGYSYQIKDTAIPQTVLWQTNTVNARGQLTTVTLGNGIAITNTYDQYGLVTQMKHDKGIANVMTLNTVFDAQRGNLTSRTNSLFGTSDTFVYDTLDRLTSYPNGLGQQLTQNYDDRGRITANNLGTYNYTNANKTYQNTSIATLTPEALTYYTARQRQNITYNTFKSPVEIEDTGFDKVSFTYNDGNDRSTMFYGGLGTKETRWLRKYYSADGTMEIKQNISTGAVEFTTYIGGDGYTAPIIVRSDGVTQKYLYLHRDYQGSILAITDANGTVLEKRLFDAWGNIAKVQDGNGNNLNVLTILDRGYTGHEHLQSVGLIHMNGRLYDPKLHRFLQPDNYVQDPSNTQNYNRYGYCWNNPLKYTDASGEWINILIGAIIGGVVNWATHGCQFNAKGLGYFGVGAVAGALTAMVGAGVSSSLAGGSFSAGALGTSSAWACTATTSFINGAIIGASGGLAGGFVTGVGNSLLDNQNIGKSLGNGVSEGLIGAASGGILGGIAGGIDAVRDGRRFFDGATVVKQTAVPPYTLQNLQQSSEASCQATCGATIDQSLGGSMTEMDVRNMMPGYDYTGAGAGDRPFWTEFATKTGRHLQSSAMTDDFSANFFNAFSSNGGGVASTRIALSTSNHSLVLQSITKIDITKISGRVITKYLLNVMDPAYGAIRSFRPSSFINYFLIR